MTSELSQQRNDAITYYTCSIISHSMKSFLGAFSSNSRLAVREVKTDCKSVMLKWMYSKDQAVYV